MLSGVARLKEKFSLAETLYRHGVLHKGMGIFKLSLPLSYPSSSSVSFHSKSTIYTGHKVTE